MKVLLNVVEEYPVYRIIAKPDEHHDAESIEQYGINVPDEMVERYLKIAVEWDALQDELNRAVWDIAGNGARIEGMDEVTITFSRKDYDALIEMLGCLHDESASDGDGYLDEWDSPELEHIKEIIRAAGSDKV